MTLRKQTRTAQSRTLLTTDTDRVAGNSYTFHKYADKAKPKEWFRCSTSQQPQKEQASAEKENIVNVRTVCTIRYDTIRDAILTCARKPT